MKSAQNINNLAYISFLGLHTLPMIYLSIRTLRSSVSAPCRSLLTRKSMFSSPWSGPRPAKLLCRMALMRKVVPPERNCTQQTDLIFYYLGLHAKNNHNLHFSYPSCLHLLDYFNSLSISSIHKRQGRTCSIHQLFQTKKTNLLFFTYHFCHHFLLHPISNQPKTKNKQCLLAYIHLVSWVLDLRPLAP